MQDIDAAAKAYQDFLTALGIDASAGINVADSARNTAILMAEMMRGLHEEKPALSVMPALSNDLVSLKNLPFYSFCGHHFVPFFGTIQIDYYPDKSIAGLGSFSRVIEFFARRPQFQENLCAQIADYIFESDLHPKAVRIQLLSRQMCMELHGAGDHTMFESIAIRGEQVLFKK